MDETKAVAAVIRIIRENFGILASNKEIVRRCALTIVKELKDGNGPKKAKNDGKKRAGSPGRQGEAERGRDNHSGDGHPESEAARRNRLSGQPSTNAYIR